MPMTQQRLNDRKAMVKVTFPDSPPEEFLELWYYPNKVSPKWQREAQDRARISRERQRRREEAEENGETPEELDSSEQDAVVQQLLEVLSNWDLADSEEDMQNGIYMPINEETLNNQGYGTLIRILVALVQDIQPDPTESKRKRFMNSSNGNQNRILSAIPTETNMDGNGQSFR